MDLFRVSGARPAASAASNATSARRAQLADKDTSNNAKPAKTCAAADSAASPAYARPEESTPASGRLGSTPASRKRALGQPSVVLGSPYCMASATSAKWRAGTFPNSCETEADWVAAQKRGITWRQLSAAERQAVALDAVRQKVEGGDEWTREAAADVEALTTQRNAAVHQEDFRRAAELKTRLDAINNGGANWFDAQSGQWRVQAGFDDINAPVWRDRTC